MTALGILILIALVLVGVPLYLAIMACSFFIMIVALDAEAWFFLRQMFDAVADEQLLAIPLFIFLGSALSAGGAGKALVRLLNSFMGHIPGGPAYALVFASMIVAAMCAHPMAAIAGFGPLIIPMMISLGYSEVFAVGLLLSSASLAPLIPPNTIGIIYCVIARSVPGMPETADVTTLWTASIIPGVLIALLLCVVVYIYAGRGHFKRLPPSSWTERWEAFKEAFPVALTPFAVLGPLYAKWANPTEVAAIGVIYVLLISRFFYSGMTWKSLWQACMSTLRILGAIFLIIMAALLLTKVFVFAEVPQTISGWISDAGLSWWTFIALLIPIYILMGMFLDPTAIVLVAVPMLLETCVELHVNIYVFGVFTILAVTMAGITPPYGLCIFATQSILQKPYHQVVRACIMFIPALIIGLVLIGFFEPLSTWLPNLLGYD